MTLEEIISGETENVVTEDPQHEEPATESESPDAAEELRLENERLRRLIATDPQRRLAYESERFGPPPQTQFASPQQPQQPQNDPALPFGEEDFDPTDMRHMQALLAHAVSQQLQPANQYITALQQRDMMEAQEQEQRNLQNLVTDVQKGIEKFVPDLYAGEMTPERVAMCDLAKQMFARELQGSYSEYLWANPMAHQEVLKKVGPQIQKMAERLGVTKPTANGNKRQMFVESVSTEPGGNPNMFEKAHKKGDVLGMLSALRST